MLTRIWKWVYPVLIIGLIMVAIVFLGSKAAQNAKQIGAAQAENHSQDKQITSLADSLAEANSKLQSAGLPTVPVVVQPSSGENGRNGDDGRSVLSISCGTGGVWTVVYDDGTIDTAGGGCIGQDGATGATGQNGTDGQPGADSTAAGPQGPPGADSTVPGPTGATGADGQPPLSWTYTDTLGAPYTCTRTDPFDATAPTYECAPTAAAPTEGDTSNE